MNDDLRRIAFLAAVITSITGALLTPARIDAQSALAWDEATHHAFQELPSVRVATDSTWPPMEYINREGELVGFDIDLLREIGLRGGFRPEFVTVPWDGIFAGLIAGQYQMIASSVTLLEERARVMRFSRPYFTAEQFLVVASGRTEVEQIEGLVGEDVGAQIGTTGARVVNNAEGVGLRAYDDLGLAVEDLAQGRLGGIVADAAIVEYFVLANERYGDLLRVAGSAYTVEQYAFAIAIDALDLHDRVDRGLADVHRDGTLRRLREFWFPSLTGQN